jgi:hypothetical protein
MIVDEADRDIELSADPFLEAGIDIPKELPYKTPTLRMKIIQENGDQLNNLSTAGSVASVVKNSASASFVRIARLNKFRKRFGSQQNLTSLEGSAADSVPIPSNRESAVIMSESMPPMKPGVQPLLRDRTMMTIPGSNSDDDPPDGLVGFYTSGRSNVMDLSFNNHLINDDHGPTLPNDGIVLNPDEMNNDHAYLNSAYLINDSDLTQPNVTISRPKSPFIILSD